MMFILIWGTSILAVMYEAVFVLTVLEMESMAFRAVLLTICVCLTLVSTGAALAALVVWGKEKVDELVPEEPPQRLRAVPCTCEKCTGLKKESYYDEEPPLERKVDFGVLEVAGTSYDGDLR
jgi:hypothetical protein